MYSARFTVFGEVYLVAAVTNSYYNGRGHLGRTATVAIIGSIYYFTGRARRVDYTALGALVGEWSIAGRAPCRCRAG